jgi:hypothetical protein
VRTSRKRREAALRLRTSRKRVEAAPGLERASEEAPAHFCLEKNTREINGFDHGGKGALTERGIAIMCAACTLTRTICLGVSADRTLLCLSGWIACGRLVGPTVSRRLRALWGDKIYKR